MSRDDLVLSPDPAADVGLLVEAAVAVVVGRPLPVGLPVESGRRLTVVIDAIRAAGNATPRSL